MLRGTGGSQARGLKWLCLDPGGFEPRPSSSKKRRFHVEVDHHGLGVLPRGSQYKCQSRHKQDTKSHHYNCDGIISGNLEHGETPKIADRPVWSPKRPKVDIRLFKEEKNDLLG